MLTHEPTRQEALDTLQSTASTPLHSPQFTVHILHLSGVSVTGITLSWFVQICLVAGDPAACIAELRSTVQHGVNVSADIATHVRLHSVLMVHMMNGLVAIYL